jgi:hypothetical protein
MWWVSGPLLRRRGFERLAVAIAAGATLAAQQMPDRGFRPMIEDRAYATGTGPVVCFDEAHRNAYTLNDGFWPFADLVRRDGYVVRETRTWDQQSLTECRILVVVGPRSAVTDGDEIRRWVSAGGGLLVIVDRDSLMAVRDLAMAFGVTFTDAPTASGRSTTRTLRPHAIARGRHAKESAARVATFASVALQAPATTEPLLVAAEGTIEGAVMRVEKGRVALFSDPALFTAQIAGPTRDRIGMNAPGGERNFQFVLNVMHWLSQMI